jgi:hypothetical protein
MSYNIMIYYDIYDHFTMEHFRLRQSMILTTSFFLLATVPMTQVSIWLSHILCTFVANFVQ